MWQQWELGGVRGIPVSAATCLLLPGTVKSPPGPLATVQRTACATMSTLFCKQKIYECEPFHATCHRG